MNKNQNLKNMQTVYNKSFIIKEQYCLYHLKFLNHLKMTQKSPFHIYFSIISKNIYARSW